MATLWSWCFPLLQCDGDRTRSQVVQTHSRRTSVPVLLIGTVQWGPTTRQIRENASDQSVGDEFGLDDQVSGDQLQQLDRRLAPALPYVKSLFVGWFEPLRDAIARDQDVQRRKRVEHIYAKYLLLLPADKMAVILMHKMMGLLMSSKDGSGSVRVVQAAHCIGEAVEREVSRLLLPCLRF
jgi:hypothetical protein